MAKFDPTKAKVLRALVLPVLKMELEEAVYVRIDDKMVKSVMREEAPDKDGVKKPAKEKKKEPATVCHVTNLVTGEQQTLICGVVLVARLNEAYENDGYIGKGFEIIKNPKEKGKDYFVYSIREIEIPKNLD